MVVKNLPSFLSFANSIRRIWMPTKRLQRKTSVECLSEQPWHTWQVNVLFYNQKSFLGSRIFFSQQKSFLIKFDSIKQDEEISVNQKSKNHQDTKSFCGTWRSSKVSPIKEQDLFPLFSLRRDSPSFQGSMMKPNEWSLFRHTDKQRSRFHTLPVISFNGQCWHFALVKPRGQSVMMMAAMGVGPTARLNGFIRWGLVALLIATQLVKQKWIHKNAYEKNEAVLFFRVFFVAAAFLLMDAHTPQRHTRDRDDYNENGSEPPCHRVKRRPNRRKYDAGVPRRRALAVTEGHLNAEARTIVVVSITTKTSATAEWAWCLLFCSSFIGEPQPANNFSRRFAIQQTNSTAPKTDWEPTRTDTRVHKIPPPPT